ncbi:MAG: site-specific integrase [Bacilli bacterium]|nr:site-specific integrase [Bacilli bacterium]
MAEVRVMKRGKVYQYQFEIASVNGTRKYINKSGFKTKAEALESGNIAYTEYINTGQPYKESKLSYSDYLDYWLDNYCKTNLKYNTIQSYTTLINKYIKPKIGKYRISNITSVALNNFITDMVNEYNFSRVYFKNLLKVLKGSFRDACNLYGIIKYNPALTIRLPKMDKVEEDIKHLYSLEEIDRILDRFKDNATFTASFLTSCYTGMRTGEVFALTWKDVDLENGIIYINHNVYDKPKDQFGRWYIGSTKTVRGTRKINIGNTLVTALLNFKKRQEMLKKLYGKEYKYYCIEDVKNEYGKVIEQRIVLNKNHESENLDLVFTRDDGTYTGTDLIRYPFKVIREELNIKCRFYDLRGTYATKILNNGTEIRDVADMLGHRNIETTENYYISSTENNRRDAVLSFDRLTSSDTINKAIKFEV